MSHLFKRKKSAIEQSCVAPFSSPVDFWTWVHEKAQGGLKSDDIKFKNKVIEEIYTAIEQYESLHEHKN
jgi:hypothetical protein